MISKNPTRKLFGKILRALPYVSRRRSTRFTPYVISAIGAAIVGGIAAVMFFSPRTRDRVLGAAKDTYGKVARSDVGQRLGIHQPEAGAQPNGPAQGSSYGTTGL